VGRLRTTGGALVAIAALTACGGAADDEGATPAPTVTVTVTETATPAPAEDPSPTAEPSPAPTGVSGEDPCAAGGLEGHAFIFVTSPAPGAELASGDTVEGCSNTFEATYQYELLDRDGTVLDEGFGTASCGSGCVGEFDFTLDFSVDEETVGTLRVFAESARDGSEELVNAIPVRLAP
jgi:hypothetical protein